MNENNKLGVKKNPINLCVYLSLKEIVMLFIEIIEKKSINT